MTPQQKLAAFTLNVTNVPALGLDIVQGALLPTAFYWDANDGTRAFGQRFLAAHPKKLMPNDMQAGMYGATAHLLKAVAATGSAADGVKLVDAMKAIPTDDPLFGKGSIREDGRALHPIFLYRAKTPAESKSEWDVFELVSTIKPEDAFRPLAQGRLSVRQSLTSRVAARKKERAEESLQPVSSNPRAFRRCRRSALSPRRSAPD